MPVFRSALTGDLHTPALVMADHLPLLEESVDASAMFDDLGRRTFATYMPPVLGVIRAEGAYHPATGRLRLYDDARAARQFMNRLLRREGCQLRQIKKRGGRRVEHDERESYIDRLLIAVRKFVDQGFELGLRSGQRPLELDGYHLKGDGERALFRARQLASAAAAGAYRWESGRYYKMPFRPDTAPRTSDVRWLKDMLAALRKANKARFVIVPLQTAGSTAARMGEVLDANFLGWWKASRFGNSILLRNKGQGDLERKRADLSNEVLEALLDYIATERRAADPHGYTIESMRELGRRHDRGDKSATRRLRAARLFLNSRGDPLEYHALVDHHLSPVMKAAEIPATCHWIRHEFVFRRLRWIDANAKSVVDWNDQREKLAEYMGWASGTAMFKIYDAFERARSAHAGVARFSQDLEDEVDGILGLTADESGLLAEDADECGELIAFGSDAWVVAGDGADFVEAGA